MLRPMNRFTRRDVELDNCSCPNTAHSRAMALIELRGACKRTDWWISRFVCLNNFSSFSSPRSIVRISGSLSCISGRSESSFSAQSVRLSSSLVLILKQITMVQWCKRSSIKTTLTKFLSTEEHFMFGIRMLLPGWLLWHLGPRGFRKNSCANLHYAMAG